MAKACWEHIEFWHGPGHQSRESFWVYGSKEERDSELEYRARIHNEAAMIKRRYGKPSAEVLSKLAQRMRDKIRYADKVLKLISGAAISGEDVVVSIDC